MGMNYRFLFFEPVISHRLSFFVIYYPFILRGSRAFGTEWPRRYDPL